MLQRFSVVVFDKGMVQACTQTLCLQEGEPENTPTSFIRTMEPLARRSPFAAATIEFTAAFVKKVTCMSLVAVGLYSSSVPHFAPSPCISGSHAPVQQCLRSSTPAREKLEAYTAAGTCINADIPCGLVAQAGSPSSTSPDLKEENHVVLDMLEDQVISVALLLPFGP